MVDKRDLGDRRKILEDVVGQLPNEARRLNDLGNGDQHGVAIGLRLGHVVVADDAAAARLVLDKDGLLPRLLQFVGKQTGEDVGGAARRIGHDEGDAPARIGIRRRCLMRRGTQSRHGDGSKQRCRGRRPHHADRQMIVHGHTPDCRHSTDKPARLDLTMHFSTSLQRNLEHGFECGQRIAPIYRNRHRCTASTELPDTCEAALLPLQVRPTCRLILQHDAKRRIRTGAKWM